MTPGGIRQRENPRPLGPRNNWKVFALIKAADLRTQTIKDLYALAKKYGLTGAYAMRKDQLVRALVKAAKQREASSRRRRRDAATTTRPRATTPRSGNGVRPKKAKVTTTSSNGKDKARQPSPTTRRTRRIERARAQRKKLKDLSHASVAAAKGGQRRTKRMTKHQLMAAKSPGKDRIVLLVRDAYWMQACWDITPNSVQRARAAMAEHWHTSRPVLRLIEVDAGSTTNTSERVVREIPIHGGVKNWYIDVQDSPRSFRVEIGYLADSDRFHGLARSNTVTTPRPGSNDAIDDHWSDVAADYEKIYAMSGGYLPSSAGGELEQLFKERMRRPMAPPTTVKFGAGADQYLRRDHDFAFDVDAALVVFGTTKADAHVTLGGQPVKLQPDGSFAVRLNMPNRRQVLPVVACSRDGVEQRTVVLAVERNTKVMEPMFREAHES